MPEMEIMGHNCRRRPTRSGDVVEEIFADRREPKKPAGFRNSYRHYQRNLRFVFGPRSKSCLWGAFGICLTSPEYSERSPLWPVAVSPQLQLTAAACAVPGWEMVILGHFPCRSKRRKRFQFRLEQDFLCSISCLRTSKMEKQFHLYIGIIAALAVALAVTLTVTASDSTKKMISENIPHGPNEKPITK